MNLKSFTFGLGLGLLFVSLIFLILYNSSTKNNIVYNNSISDNEIIERAKKLGMVFYKELPENQIDIESNIITEIETEATTYISNIETELSTYEENTEYITIRIERGSNAYVVSKVLYDNGLVDDIDDFKQYLIDAQKTRSLKTGTYNIPIDSDYETITNIITKRPK